MKQIIIIEADTNDADYVTRETVVKSDKQLELIKKFAKLIKNFEPYKGKSRDGMVYNHDHNWPNGEYTYRPDLGGKSVKEIYGGKVTEAELEEFSDMLPFGEYGIHTIESIRILTISEDKELL